MPRRHYLDRRPKTSYTPESLKFLADYADQKRREAREEAERIAQLAAEQAKNLAALEAEREAKKAEQKAAEEQAALAAEKAAEEEKLEREREENARVRLEFLAEMARLKKERSETLRKIQEEIESRLPRILAHPKWRLYSRKAQEQVLQMERLFVLENLDSDEFRVEVERAIRQVQ